MADLFFKWDPVTLSVKVKDMDSEHEQIINKMNKLHERNQHQATFGELKMLMDDFVKYALKHFADEEQFMEKVGFKDLAVHKIIHKRLVETLGEHLQRFEHSQKLGDDFFIFLSTWLSAHIKGIDVNYGNSANWTKSAS